MSEKYEQLTLEEVTRRLDYSKVCAFDTETCGFYGKIRLAQFFQDHFEKPVLVEWPSPMELVAVLTKLHIVGHRINYDISTIQEQLGKQMWLPEKFDCTFLASRLHFYTKDGFSLDKVVQYDIGLNPYEQNDQQLSDWSVPVLSEAQKEYAADDVKYLLHVWQTVSAVKDDLNYVLDILTTRNILEMQVVGVPFSEQKLNEQYAENMKKIGELGLKINCNSPQQVRAYIGSSMSDDKGLAQLSAQGNEKAKQVRATRKLMKQNSFLTKYINIAVDGRIFGKFTVGARSGRTTCDDENLQTIPRKLRHIFEMPEDGDEVFIYSDFAAIQLRCVCAVTGDVTLEKLFREGIDLHNYVAEMIFGPEWTEELHRQIAKTANYTLLFGAGIIVLILTLLKDTGIWLKENDATNTKRKWLQTFKQIAQWQTQGIRDWKKGVVWQTPLGRKYTAKMMTDQLAMQIQGFEAEVAKLAMHYMLPKIRVLDPRVKLCNFMHDSYLFICPKEEVLYKAVCIIIADAMQEAWREMCNSVKIRDLPMPVKVSVGFNWHGIDKKGVFIHEHKQ